MQITGMLLGMTGTIIVSVGDPLVKAFSRCFKDLRGLVAEDGQDRQQQQQEQQHYKRLRD
jgi:hypothetical protein